MSTYLELANELRRIAGIQGADIANVATATGINLMVVNYIKNAWIDIQNHPKQWRWMLLPFYQSGTTPLQTADATNDYTLPTTVTTARALVVNSFKSYLTATGVSDRQRMTWLPYRDFERRYGVVTAADNRPAFVTRVPGSQKLRFHPQPDGIYSIEFDHFKSPQVLSASGDTPEMPSEHHQLIVYEALKRFGKAEDAPELIKLGEEAAGSEGSEGRPVSGLWRGLIWSQEVREQTDDREDTQMTVTTREPYEDF